MSREVMEILHRVEDQLLISPFDLESDDIIIDGKRFSHQDLMLDIF